MTQESLAVLLDADPMLEVVTDEASMELIKVTRTLSNNGLWCNFVIFQVDILQIIQDLAKNINCSQPTNSVDVTDTTGKNVLSKLRTRKALNPFLIHPLQRENLLNLFLEKVVSLLTKFELLKMNRQADCFIDNERYRSFSLILIRRVERI